MWSISHKEPEQKRTSQTYLELGDTVANWYKLGETPDETILLNGSDSCLESLHVGLIVPRLDLESDDRLVRGVVSDIVSI